MSEQVEKRLDTDKVFLALGKYGRYQMQSFFCGNIVSVFLALQYLQIAFINDVPDFYCTDENITSPYNETNQPICYETFDNLNHCGTNGSYFKYNLKFGTTIASEWNLVCNKAFYSAFVGSLFMFGCMLGALFITQLSDIFGRRWLFLLTNWLLLVISLAQGFVPNYVAFATVRFLTGILYAGIGAISWVICCENITIATRSYAALGSMFWTLGYMLMGVLAYFVRDWRRLSIYISLPIISSISFYWLVPETLHWYIAVGKNEKAELWISTASKCNKTKVDIDQCYNLRQINADLPSTTQIKRNLIDIFKSKVLMPQYLSICYIWICNSFVYFGLSIFSTKFSGDRYVNFFLSGLVEIPSFIIATYCMEKFGRRLTSVVFHLITGVSLLILVFIPETTNNGINLIPLIITLSMIGKFAISVTFTVIWMLAAEIFPTTVRTVGIGSCATIGRIGSLVAPYVLLLESVNKNIAPTMFGCMALIAAAATYMIVETKGIYLPEDLEDVRPSKLQTILCPCLQKAKTSPVNCQEKVVLSNLEN